MFSDRFTLLGTILLAITSGFLIWNLRMQREVTGWVDHTESVLDGSQQLLRLFVDAETAERGFLITDAERYLEPYNQALAELPDRRRELRRLTVDNPVQQTRLDRLDRLTLVRLNTLSEGLQEYRNHGSDAARSIVLTGAGKDSMDQIRSLLAQFQMQERELLRVRLRRRAINQAGTAFGAGASSLLGLSFLLVSSRRQRANAAEKLSLLRSEEELRVLRRLIEQAPMGIVILDRRLCTVGVSQRWLDDNGLTRDATLGRSHHETFPHLPGHWSELHRRGLAGEALSGNEENYLAADGREHWVNWRILPWGDGGESTGGIAIYSDDITPRKRAEQALAASESRYRGLFDHMNHGVAYCQAIPAIGAAEPDFVYLAVNTQFEVLTGMKNIAGQRASEVLPLIGERDPELLQLFETVALTGVPQKFERFMNTQGQWQAVSVYCPQRGFFVAMFDVIDARKRAEAAARQWQRAFDEAAFGIAVADAVTGEIIAVNAAYSKGLGYSKEELVGEDICRFYPEEELVHRAEVLRAANSGLGHALFESRHQRKDGTSYPVLIDVTIVRDDAGHPVSRVKIVHDLSELRRTGDALRASEVRALSLSEHTSEGILTTNREGLIVDVNAAVQVLFGYSSAELIGAPVEMLLPDNLRNKHVAHRAVTTCNLVFARWDKAWICWPAARTERNLRLKSASVICREITVGCPWLLFRISQRASVLIRSGRK